jgi:hypothetical protein
VSDPAFYSDASRNSRERDRALRRQSLRQAWPTLFMIPGLVGVLHACAFAVLINVFLGPTFGLSGGQPAPWPGAIAIIFLLSFRVNWYVGRWEKPGVLGQAATFVAWAAVWAGWIALDPAFDESSLFRDPGQLVESDAWLIPSLLISLVVWWLGIVYASGIANISAEELRSVVQRDWLILFGSILLAAVVGGEAGADGLAAARLAVPLQLLVSVALIAGAETEVTRRMAFRRGGTAPGWGRWFRLVGAVGAGVALATVLVLALLSPGALDAIVGAITTVLGWIGLALQYVLYAIVWSIFQVMSLVARLFNSLFGDMLGPVQTPTMPIAPPLEFPEQVVQEDEGGTWEYAILLRWGLLGAIILTVAVVLFRLSRRDAAPDDDGIVDEQRDSVFSTDLARQQLRDLFRRRGREAAPVRLNLDRPPADVREAMLYLEVLANRQGEGRRPEESASDFAARLRAHWSGVAAPLVQFPDQYARVRYGEEERAGDAEAAARIWSQIWSARKVADGPGKQSPD